MLIVANDPLYMGESTDKLLANGLGWLYFALLSLAGIAVLLSRPWRATAPPAQGEYHDLIRRELDATGTALSTGVLILHHIDENRVPATSGRVLCARLPTISARSLKTSAR